MQPDVFADAVVVMVKNALAPVLADVKTLQSQVSSLETRWNDVGALRERVAVIEAAPVAPAIEAKAVDLSPLTERLAAAEARLGTLGDLRDRVVTIEAKALQPATVTVSEPATPVDLSPALERIAAAEARLDVVGDLRDRMVAVETKAAMPAPAPAAVDLSPLIDRIGALEFRVEEGVKYLGLAETAIHNLTSDHVATRERLAAVEVRPLMAGPAGKDGEKGLDGLHGKDGKDGADGIGFDDLIVAQADERTFTVKAARGERVKDIGTVSFPVEIYRGVFVDGKSYERGDGVTWAGSEWHANEDTTSKPGDGSKSWTLKVKRGRDGKDGRDASGAPPVVRVR